jgi:hypothetical protein
MLDLANDIRSLSDFKRNTVDLLDRLRKTGHPMVLTINGKAELVVQDAEAYQGTARPRGGDRRDSTRIRRREGRSHEAGAASVCPVAPET